MTRFGQTRTPTLAEVLRAAITAQLGNVHIALPARIEQYDEAEQKINAKPLLQNNVILSDGTEADPDVLPCINNVPVVFPRGGGFFMSLPLAVGDHVLLIFNERSIDKFLQGDGGDTNPTDVRMHDLSDAVAIPGFYPFGSSLADADPDNIVIGKENGVQVHVAEDKIELGEKGAGEKAVIDSKLQNELSKIASELSKIATALTTIDTQTHTGNLGMPTSPPVPLHAASISYSPAGTDSALVTLKE